MRIPLAVAVLACVSFATGNATAHPRETITTKANIQHSHHKVKIATATDDDAPRARIRGDRTGKGLTPQAFSRWASRHPGLIQPKRAESSLRVLASTAPQRRSLAAIFDIADTNQDGLVSADELADFLMHNAEPQRLPSDAT